MIIFRALFYIAIFHTAFDGELLWVGIVGAVLDIITTLTVRQPHRFKVISYEEVEGICDYHEKRIRKCDFCGVKQEGEYIVDHGNWAGGGGTSLRWSETELDSDKVMTNCTAYNEFFDTIGTKIHSAYKRRKNTKSKLPIATIKKI